MSNLLDKVLYCHRRNDDFSIFYVGVGTKRRPYVKQKRNAYWDNIVNKHGYTVQVLKENLSSEDAFELEELIISELGRKDNKTGFLSNMTDGGFGTINLSEETRAKISESKKGIPIFPKGTKFTEEHKKNISKGCMGRISSFKNRSHSEESKLKISSSLKGKKHSEERKLKISLNSKQSIKVINIETNEVYKSIKIAAEMNGLSVHTLRWQIRKGDNNPTKFRKYE